MQAIADAVGVSVMTVSRYFSGKANLKASTAEAIRLEAERRQYRPNRLVRAMKSGRSGLIGVILPSQLGYYGEVLAGIQETLAERGNFTLLELVHGNLGPAAIEEESRIIRRLVEMRIEGIILRPVNDLADSLYFSEVRSRDIPLVVIDRRLKSFEADFVGTDDEAGGRQAARQLIAAGARRLLLISAGAEVSTSADRAAGFIAEVRAHRGVTHEELSCPDFAPNEARIDAFLASNPRRFDGIFAVGDILALGCLRALRARQVRIPDEVSLLGFGALGLGGGHHIPVSSFDQHPAMVGRLAAQCILERARESEQASPVLRLVPATYTPRGTVRA
jgi:LacI family transcriptional regulator